MSGERRTVFLVDDGACNLAAGRDSLSREYRVFTCASADLMFRALERTRPDLILLDVEMPGTDGFQAMERLRADARFAGIPVAFLSARGDEESRARGLSLGAAGYAAKPLSGEPLLELVREAMAGA